MNECAICFDECTVALATLECGHTFHTKCLCRAVQRTNTCPLCRSIIFEKVETSHPTQFVTTVLQSENQQINNWVRSVILRIRESEDEINSDAVGETIQDTSDDITHLNSTLVVHSPSLSNSLQNMIDEQGEATWEQRVQDAQTNLMLRWRTNLLREHAQRQTSAQARYRRLPTHQ